MPNTIGFTSGLRYVELTDAQTKQLLEATSAKQAYRTQGGGLWEKFADFFCLGNDRKAIRDLFDSIASAPGHTDPIEQLSRFKRLSFHARAEYADNFTVYAEKNTDEAGAWYWKYNFKIGEDKFYQSEWQKVDTNNSTMKNFCAKAMAWNTQQAIKRMNNEPQRTRENYAINMLNTLSDIPGTSTQVLQEKQPAENGTSRAYLNAHLIDSFFSRSNFREIIMVPDQPLFDVIFERDGEQRILRLSNRPATREFRGEVAQKAFQEREYTNLCDLLSCDYSSEKDHEWLYLLAEDRQMLRDLIGDSDMQDPDVREIFKISVERNNGRPVLLSALMLDSPVLMRAHSSVSHR